MWIMGMDVCNDKNSYFDICYLYLYTDFPDIAIFLPKKTIISEFTVLTEDNIDVPRHY